MRAPPPLSFPSTSHTHHCPSLSSFLSLCRVHPHIELLPLPLRPLWNRGVGDVCRRRQAPGIRLNPAGDCAKRRDHFLEEEKKSRGRSSFVPRRRHGSLEFQSQRICHAGRPDSLQHLLGDDGRLVRSDFEGCANLPHEA